MPCSGGAEAMRKGESWLGKTPVCLSMLARIALGHRGEPVPGDVSYCLVSILSSFFPILCILAPINPMVEPVWCRT